MSYSEPPADQFDQFDQAWPERDLRPGESRTAEGPDDEGRDWDVRSQGDRRRPTTAEQAVPWLIAVILALAGIVIVLLALIFSSDGTPSSGTAPSNGVGFVDGAQHSRIPKPSASPTAEGRETPSPSATPSSPEVTPDEEPTYGPLEMVYLSRGAAAGPIHLFHRDFEKKRAAEEVAQPAAGVTRFTWAPDGTIGAALIGTTGEVRAIRPEKKDRTLLDGADAITFGGDASTLYAVTITTSGTRDTATVRSIDVKSGDAHRLTQFSYPHQQIFPDPLLQEAAFADDGGTVRLFPTNDGNLVLWILGAPGTATYRIDPVDGTRTEVRRAPVLWSPDGSRRVDVNIDKLVSTLTLRNRAAEASASVKIDGLVSHLRWSADGSEVSFTLGRVAAAGGVIQDLYIWDLVDGKKPMAITSNGTSFGAEWLGAAQSWEP